jgi:hypothetical protein
MAPPLPSIPPELHGRPVIAVISCYAGDIETGEEVLRPLRRFGQPLLDLCAPKPFVQHQSMFDPSFRHGWWYHVRSCDIERLDDEVIGISAAHALQLPSPLSTCNIFHLGGAVARVGEDDTACSGRSVGHTFNINGNCVDAEGFDEARAWARSWWSALKPHHAGVYVNFLMEEGASRVEQAYGADKLRRLRLLKKEYDPGNVFRSNQNIAPAS